METENKETVCIFTVGGSPEPIINAIKELKPNFVYFICSGGPPEVASERLVDGIPQKKDEKIIVKETGLSSSNYEKVILPIEIIDYLDKAYEELEKNLIKRLKERFSETKNLRIIANYTGGTKTMSVALVLLSIFQENWELQINTGLRTNIIKLDRGDFPVSINKINLLYKFDLIFFENLMQKFYYEEILERIEKYLQKSTIYPEIRSHLILLRNILTGFIWWDKFNHEEAFKSLEDSRERSEEEIKETITKYFLTLKLILGKMGNSTGYEIVWDLVLNAERRAVQERYDDAIARLYRALEMLAQVRLKTFYHINPSNITPEFWNNLPEKAKNFLFSEYERNKDEKGILKIPLVKCYELLYFLEDPIGIFYKEKKEEFLNTIKMRNYSILAHGEKPIFKENFEKVYPFFKNFIEVSLKEKLRLKLDMDWQFPRSFKDLGIN